MCAAQGLDAMALCSTMERVVPVSMPVCLSVQRRLWLCPRLKWVRVNKKASLVAYGVPPRTPRSKRLAEKSNR